VLTYFYDIIGTPESFLRNTGAFSALTISDPYILIFSSGSSADITLDTDNPFTLPEMKITTEARK
jgi:hypothetical protein